MFASAYVGLLCYARLGDKGGKMRKRTLRFSAIVDKEKVGDFSNALIEHDLLRHVTAYYTKTSQKDRVVIELWTSDEEYKIFKEAFDEGVLSEWKKDFEEVKT